MKYYFSLQFRMLNRHILEFGLNPYVGYVLSGIVFTCLSFYLFYKTEYALYIYILIASSVFTKASESSRNQFLKSIFSNKSYYSIRLVENFTLSIPFFIFLAFKSQWIGVAILLALALSLAIVRLENKWGITIPTPFASRPFEFTVGFRNTFFVFILVYILTYISISVDNFNLGMFCLILIFLVCMSFYTYPERQFYAWIYSDTPGKFLFRKGVTAFINSSILALPIVVSLAIFFPGMTMVIIGILLICYIYLLTVVLAKYSAFPGNISIPQGVLFALTIWFPPLLIGIIPIFYIQSKKKLSEILE